MSCQIEPTKIEATIAFHGHSCPGLAIGIRAAEIALRELPGVDQADLVCVTETDMCGVDAIQFLTGCTYGKGNLIHRDCGKLAFSFHDRRSGRGFRLVFNQQARGELHREMVALMGKGLLAETEQQRLQALRAEMQQRLMTLPADELFAVQPLDQAPPRPARVLQSLVCDDCGESTMESRTRRFAGRTLCIPCFARIEQKI
ncbi:MAG: FmdE family protein [Desulfoprunum sp.]|uniref:FmdE family protein n=1 Tax=Desulfoprunum sp. TaxID=2020866 RepID=UPI003C794E75